MYLSLDEKRCTFYVNYFSFISLCNLSNVPMARINSVKFSIDPVTKISSTEFTFFGQALPNTRSAKISALTVIELCSSNELLYGYIQGILIVIKSN